MVADAVFSLVVPAICFSMPAVEMFCRVVLKLEQEFQRMCVPVVVIVAAMPKKLPQVVVKFAKQLRRKYGNPSHREKH